MAFTGAEQIESPYAQPAESTTRLVPVALLNVIFREALQTIKQEGTITWRSAFFVTGIDQHDRPKTEWNIHLYCDDYSKSNRQLWRDALKGLVAPKVLKTLKCEQFWIYLDGPKPGLLPVDPSLPAKEFQAKMTAFRQKQRAEQEEIAAYLRETGQPLTLDHFEGSDKVTQQMLDAIAPSTFQRLGANINHKDGFDPVDGKRICGIGMKRCVSCTCLNED